MGTAACVRFYPTDEQQKDGDGDAGVVTIYKACDGYPDGVIPFLIAASRFSLPRYESDDFAAAFVAATLAQDDSTPETKGGLIRIVPFEGDDAYARYASYIEYLYDVRWLDGEVRVFFVGRDGRDRDTGVCQMPSGVLIT